MKTNKFVVGALASVMAASSLCGVGVNASTVGTTNKSTNTWNASSWGSASSWKDQYDKWVNSTVQKTVEAKISDGTFGSAYKNFDITWKQLEDATSYKVQVATDMFFRNVVLEKDVENWASGYSPILSTEKGFDKDVCGGDIYVRVKPIFDEKEGLWCNPIYVKGYEDTKSPFGTVQHDPVTLKITQNYMNKATRKIQYEWTTVKGATGYRVEFNSTGDFSNSYSLYYTTNNNYGYWLGGGTNLWDDPAAHCNYYVRVQPIFGNRDGVWSDVLTIPGDQ